MPLLVAFAVRRVPLAEQGLYGVGLEDRLLLQLLHHPRVMPLLQLGAQALRFCARLLERHQRIGAEVKAAGATVIAKAQLKGDLALGRHAHT
ncbi:hypothetical protein D3C76_1259640 [compost metagenome]